MKKQGALGYAVLEPRSSGTESIEKIKEEPRYERRKESKSNEYTAARVSVLRASRWLSAQRSVPPSLVTGVPSLEAK